MLVIGVLMVLLLQLLLCHSLSGVRYVVRLNLNNHFQANHYHTNVVERQ